MTKKLGVLFLFGIFSACQNAAEPVESQNTTIEKDMQAAAGRSAFFYNVENLFDTIDDPLTRDDDFTPNGRQQWNSKRYFKKLENLTQAILDLDGQIPALIGLVEIENETVLKDLRDALGPRAAHYQIAHFDSPDARGIDNALLIDSEVFSTKDSEKLAINFDWNRDMKTRDILYVKLEDKNAEILHVFVNHWSSRREGTAETEPKRLRAAHVLRAKMNRIVEENPSANFLIVGDFNDMPNDKSLIGILQAGAENSRSDLVNLMTDDQEKSKGTISYRREWMVFDQMIVSRGLLDENGLKIKGKDAKILKSPDLIFTYKDGGQKPNATYGGPNYYGGFSDHLPIYLYFE